ncbi:MAG: hypothetical protein ACR2QF_06030 [Geminicoccaceae bacterium]
MAQRLPASMRTREKLSSLIEGRLASPTGRSASVDLVTQLVVKKALEGEARDTRGREYDEDGAEPSQGYHNGAQPGREGAGGSLAKVQSPRAGQLSGAVTPDRPRIH